jgi:hypothetical protein
MALRVFVGVPVNEAVDTSSTESGRSYSLALCSCPGAIFFAAAEGLDGTGD